jgi:signal transduction histidine kinase
VSYFAQTSHTDNGETYQKMPPAFLRARMLLRRTSLTGRKSMIRSFMIAVASAAVFTLSTTAFAQGTASEAKAMLEKAVAAVKADKAKALDTINKGEGGFLDRDLYVFCFNSGDGNIVATGTSNPAGRKVIGQNVKTLKDATGKLYGPDLYAAAKEGQITEVSYMFPKPGTDTTPVAKVSFVTKAGDLGCGVGYYK